MRRLILVCALLAGCGGDDPPPQGLRCSGEGTPVVVVAGLGVDARSTWAGVREELRDAPVRVCEYDRPGTGTVDPEPGRRTAAVMAHELHTLLADVATPRVLVGASFGGYIARLEASAHPGDVAGVVLVDSLHPAWDDWEFERIMGSEEEAARREALARNGEGVTFDDLLVSGTEVRRAGRFPDVPLVVLRHGISFDPGGEPVPPLEASWARLQRRLAALSPQGTVVEALHSHHRIAEDEPALVADAVRSVLGR